MKRKSFCPNLNHRRSDAQLRFCPNCGEVVNDAIPIRVCSKEMHARMRRNQSKYCPNCGDQLIADR
jgi:predicted RNA-binding Zn-ribbon protein involved in translation (DUF1610 family)